MNLIIKKILNILLVASQYTPLALVWMLKATFIDWPMKKISFWRMPAIAENMGLAHVKSDYYKEFGKIVGNMRGCHVEVIPDNSMNPLVRVNSPVRIEGLELSISKPNMRPQGKVIDFSTPDWQFNLVFKTRRALRDDGESISRDAELQRRMVAFYQEWIYALEGFRVDDDGIYCTLRYGFYIFPYIPASKLEDLLEGLVDIAERLYVRT